MSVDFSSAEANRSLRFHSDCVSSAAFRRDSVSLPAATRFLQPIGFRAGTCMELLNSGQKISVDSFVLGLLTLSLAGNVYLGVRVVNQPGSVLPTAVKPAIGETVGDFNAQDSTAATRVPSETKLNTVYYVFTPSCQWCARNLENLRAIVAGAGSTYRVVAVSLDPDVMSYVAANEITFPIFVNPTRETSAAYGLGSVPQTIVVSPKGIVLHHWRGAYGPPILREISEALSVRLPGLKEPSTAGDH